MSLFARGAARLQRQRRLEGDEGGMRRRGGGVFIDASSNTFTYSGIGVRSARSPPVLLPQVLAWLQPSLRMVLMLREPGERYFSAYSYYNRRYRIYDHYGPRGALCSTRWCARRPAPLTRAAPATRSLPLRANSV